MFSDLLESTVVRKQTNKRWTIVLSTVVQMVSIGVLIVIPLIHAEALPRTMLSVFIVAPPPPPPPPQTGKTMAKPGVRLIHGGKVFAPTLIPKYVEKYVEPELPPDLISSAQTSEVFSNIPGQDTIANTGPKPPSAQKVAQPTRINQGGVVMAASLINQIRPLYPALAVQARIQGSVVLHAIIDKDGNVAQLEVISGHPLLVPAALNAVKQWRYRPTLLNGDPVEVDTTITVTFTLGG